MLKKTRTMITVFLVLILAVCGIPPARAEDQEFTGSNLTYPVISSRYAYLIDADTDQVLWSKDGEVQMYPASMTKIMTIILGLEYLHDLDQTVRITRDMWMGLVDEGASTAGFRIGDSPTVRDLLYASALRSAAEACNAIAYAVGGSMENFVDLMNKKAMELGMTGTHFTNPTGLHDVDHYSTCRDIAVLMKYCMKNEMFRTILAAKEYTTGRLYSRYKGIHIKSGVWYYVNTVGHGYQIPGFLGGKPGYTVPAGRCLVSACEISGMNLILVTGRTPGLTSHFADAKIAYQWAGETFQRYTLAYEGTRIAVIPVKGTDARNNEIKVTLPEDVVYDMPKGTQVDLETSFISEAEAPLKKGAELGSCRIVIEGNTVYEMVFTAQKDYPLSISADSGRLLDSLLSPYVLIPVAVIAAFILLLLLAMVLYRSKGREKIIGKLEEREEMEYADDEEISASFQILSDLYRSRPDPENENTASL